ncbi:MAG: hypothetical protein LAT82_03400 [Nanoarchaeota archaeon]|nr:hypothetical protein [Nanoarchaeota archaeon]
MNYNSINNEYDKYNCNNENIGSTNGVAKSFEYVEFIRKLTNLGERQFENIKIAQKIIEEELSKRDIEYSLFTFSTSLPRIKSSNCIIDKDILIEHKPTCFIGGEINSNQIILSSLTSSQDFLYKNNINFNPLSNSISKANYYFAPAIAVHREDVLKISKAKEISISVDVEKVDLELNSIMVGNMKNPKYIVFSHFDSIQKGAIDNASGTSVCLDTICSNPQILEMTLFVFDANEELSYDEPVYWGRGYRQFEEQYLSILQKCEKIIVVDCIGYSYTNEYKDEGLLKLAFPIKYIDELNTKISVLAGDFDKLMRVYHSDDDSLELIEDEFYQDAKEKLINIINK